MASTPHPFADDILLVFYVGDPSAEFIAKLEGRYPGLKVRWLNVMTEDGQIRTALDFPAESFEGVTMLFAYHPVPAHLVPKLRFVQLTSAGSDLWASHEKFLDRKTIFCTTSGAQAPQIAEWVMGTWLSFQHHFPQYVEQQKTATWEHPMKRTVEDSVGLRVGILGYGAIGRQVGRIAKAVGMEVYAFTSRERSTPASRIDSAFTLPGLGDKDGLFPTRWFHGTTKDSVNDFLAQDLDLLVISLPLTKTTHGLVSSEQFRILQKKKTFVVNIARGPIVDQEALIEALDGGWIRGAALDVTDPEPLPAEHPLWKAKNCFITPHVSWQSTHQMGRILELLEKNLDNLAEGKPLINALSR